MRFGAVIIGLLGLLGLGAAFGAFYTVDAGERAVILRYGAVHGTADAGLHFKMPFVDSVETISTRTFTIDFPNEPFYSKDQQAATATVSVTVSAKPNAVEGIYTNFKDVDSAAQQIINRRVKKEFKEVMGTFNAATAIQERERMGVEVAKAITVENPYLIVHSVQVEDIDFSDAYEKAIEDRMLAEVAIDTTTQNLAKERKLAEITVTQKKAIADSNFEIKAAEARGIREIGDAEAAAIKAKGDALRENPNLVDLIKVERWQGVLPTHVLPNGTVPFLDVAK